jgi:hypothetical protein
MNIKHTSSKLIFEQEDELLFPLASPRVKRDTAKKPKWTHKPRIPTRE